MAKDSDARDAGVRGDAAWKAERNATEQRNAAAQQQGRARRTATEAAASERERRREVLENAELVKLNRKLDAPDTRGS